MLGMGEATFPSVMQTVLPFLTRKDWRPCIMDMSPFDTCNLYVHPMHKVSRTTDLGLIWAQERSGKTVQWSDKAVPWIFRTKWFWQPVDESWNRGAQSWLIRTLGVGK